MTASRASLTTAVIRQKQLNENNTAPAWLSQAAATALTPETTGFFIEAGFSLPLF
jgi:hypothetical protein